MTYIENIYICIVLPLLLSLFFIRGKSRTTTVFILIGMTVCYLSAYVNSFFSAFYMTDAVTAAVEISPVCEEIMKLIPLLMYVVILEPKRRDIPAAAIAISVGFATFENVCFLTENGAEDFFFLFARGMSAGALHILITGRRDTQKNVRIPRKAVQTDGEHSHNVLRSAALHTCRNVFLLGEPFMRGRT